MTPRRGRRIARQDVCRVRSRFDAHHGFSCSGSGLAAADRASPGTVPGVSGQQTRRSETSTSTTQSGIVGLLPYVKNVVVAKPSGARRVGETLRGVVVSRSSQQESWNHDHTFGEDLRKPGEPRTLLVALLTAATMLLEIAAGIAYGSMALLADGLHMASHADGAGDLHVRLHLCSAPCLRPSIQFRHGQSEFAGRIHRSRVAGGLRPDHGVGEREASVRCRLTLRSTRRWSWRALGLS